MAGERVRGFSPSTRCSRARTSTPGPATACTDKEFENGARVLARFHALGHDFDPGDLAREQPPIWISWASSGTFESTRPPGRGTAFDQYLSREAARDPRRRPAGASPRWRAGGAAARPGATATTTRATSSGSTSSGVGLFDFDWAKLDYRLFDVAIGIVYFCSSWEGQDDGDVRLDKAEIFVRPTRTRRALRGPRPDDGRGTGAAAAHGRRADLYILNWDLSPTTGPDRQRRRVPGVPRAQCAFMDFIEAHLTSSPTGSARKGAACGAWGRKGRGGMTA